MLLRRRTPIRLLAFGFWSSAVLATIHSIPQHLRHPGVRIPYEEVLGPQLDARLDDRSRPEDREEARAALLRAVAGRDLFQHTRASTAATAGEAGGSSSGSSVCAGLEPTELETTSVVERNWFVFVSAPFHDTSPENVPTPPTAFRSPQRVFQVGLGLKKNALVRRYCEHLDLPAVGTGELVASFLLGPWERTWQDPLRDLQARYEIEREVAALYARVELRYMEQLWGVLKKLR